MSHRPKGRPTFKLRQDTINQIREWIVREKPIWGQGRNYHFTILSDLFNVTPKMIRNYIQDLLEEDMPGIKIQTIEKTFYNEDGEPYTETLGIHINPPGSDQEGCWLWFPVARTVFEDTVTLVLRGELLRYWNERPRFPLVQALLG